MEGTEQDSTDLMLPFLSRAAPGSTSRALEAVDAALALTVNSWLRKHGKVTPRRALPAQAVPSPQCGWAALSGWNP